MSLELTNEYLGEKFSFHGASILNGMQIFKELIYKKFVINII